MHFQRLNFLGNMKHGDSPNWAREGERDMIDTREMDLTVETDTVNSCNRNQQWVDGGCSADEGPGIFVIDCSNS